jgi:hypothetical protein
MELTGYCWRRNIGFFLMRCLRGFYNGDKRYLKKVDYSYLKNGYLMIYLNEKVEGILKGGVESCGAVVILEVSIF